MLKEEVYVIVGIPLSYLDERGNDRPITELEILGELRHY
jgi:hypothetical protein